MTYDPESFAKVASTQEFSVATRVGLSAAVIDSWQGDLLREPRVCVPVDVQALVVPATGPAGTEGVPLLGPLSPGSGADGLAAGDPDAAHAAVTGPDPFAAPTPRTPGVHLHWAMPDSLLRGELADPTPQRAPRPTPARPRRAVASAWPRCRTGGWSCACWRRRPAPAWARRAAGCSTLAPAAPGPSPTGPATPPAPAPPRCPALRPCRPKASPARRAAP